MPPCFNNSIEFQTFKTGNQVDRYKKKTIFFNERLYAAAVGFLECAEENAGRHGSHALPDS
jgi:hypothetical protein